MCSSRLAKWLKLQERLPSKCEALSSKPHPAKKKKKRKKKRKQCVHGRNEDYSTWLSFCVLMVVRLRRETLL
jgi:hypothetical protein